ncbi:MAG: TetR/AcrR family transcriptional regulator [Candidatus Saccharibacteria bacterium]
MDIRERIIEACQELAQNRGFYNMSVDELAAKAGISKRTLYRYFRSKDDVIEASIDLFMHDVAAEAERVLGTTEDPVTIVSTMMAYVYTRGNYIVGPQGLYDLQRYYPHFWKKIDDFRVERITAIIAVVLAKNPAGMISEIDPRIVTSVVLSSIQAVINPTFLLENNLTFPYAITQLSKLLINALLK